MERTNKGWIVLLVVLLFSVFAPASGQTFDERKKQVDDYFQRSCEMQDRGNEDAADEWMRKAMDVALQINGGNNITYVSLEYVQAERLRNRDKDVEALPLLEDAYARYRKISTLQTDMSVNVLQALAETTKYLGRYDEALQWCNSFRDGSKFLYGMLSESYSHALYLLADVHLKLRHHVQARQTLLEYLACLIKTGTYDESSFDVCLSYMYLGYCEHELGNYDDAEDYYEMADSLFWANDKWKKTHVLLLNMRGVNFISLGQTENADSCIKWGEELQGEISEENGTARKGAERKSTDWVPKLNRASLLMAEDPAQALEAFADILVDMEAHGDTTSLVYATAMASAGVCCSYLDDDETAVSCLETSIPLLRAENNPLADNLLQALAFRAAAYEGLGNVEMLEVSCRETSDFISNAVTRAFPLLTESERAPLWNRFRDWYSRLLPTYALDHQTAGLRRACYDAVLQSRGLLLNSSLNVERILRRATDPELKDLYKQWTQARQMGMSTATRELLEKRILQRLPEQGDFMSDMHINTDSLLSHMRPGDVAIEFLAVEQSETEDSLYAALVLTPRNAAPGLYPLVRSGELERIELEPLTSDALYRNLWGKIPDEVWDGAKRVFFAVDGELHRIPIEYCPDSKGRSMFERYECHRLSSTRELVRTHTFSGRQNVLLYGDVDYDATLSTNMDSVKIHSDEMSEENGADGMLQSRLVRGGSRGVDDSELQNVFQRLRGTKEEIEQIASILGGEEGHVAECRNGKQATERSVKDLSGRSPRWLHFATHGFYVPEADSQGDSDDEQELAESSMLSRSALVMAGANRYLKDGQYDASNGDGFLTAYEMSSLDLSGTDLVVMSACESGLGDIGSEGVFGLQRGVKKAGVHSILMTLSRVNDHATMLFMVAFYKGLAAGRSKMQALREAQKYVRKCEGGRWNAPKYWTPFVLLDDI